MLIMRPQYGPMFAHNDWMNLWGRPRRRMLSRLKSRCLLHLSAFVARPIPLFAVAAKFAWDFGRAQARQR